MCFRLFVECRKRIVENQNRPFVVQGSRKGKALRLTTGEADTARSDQGMDSVFHCFHFIFQADDSDHLLCALFSPETDILFHASMEQLRVMAKITDHAVPVCFFHFSKFFSAEGDASLIRRLAEKSLSKR